MLKFPLRRIWVSADTEDHGYNAYDFGWWDKVSGDPDSGRNPNLYAMSDGIVSYIDNSHPYDPDMVGYGNHIIISYPKEVRASLFAHIKPNSFTVKVKDKVAQMQKVAQVGNSGYSFGEHLHMEICKALSFSRHNGEDYIKNQDVYIDSWYIVDPETQRDYPLPMMVIEPVDRDVTVTQIEVICDDLNVRTEPNTSSKSMGFAQRGFYNVTEVVDGWAKVDKYYLAILEDSSVLREASFMPTEPNPLVNQAEVTINDLRIRYDHSTDSTILGYCPEGYYDVEETWADDNYVWFKCCGYWIAFTDGVIYHGSQEDPKDKKIRELEEEVTILKEQIAELEDNCETQAKVIKQQIEDFESIRVIAARNIPE